MNSYINGKGFSKGKDGFYTFSHKRGNHKRLNDWIKREFPVIYKEWLKTDIKQTGVNISKDFETRVIQDPRIYRKAKELGYVLGNENDGFGIFSNNRNETDFASFLEFVEGLSLEILGSNLYSWIRLHLLQTSYN